MERDEAGVALTDDDGLDRVAEAFAGVIDAKSPYTARHRDRRRALTRCAIGERLGFDPPEVRDLRRAGLLHDIGKLGVSSLILDKPGKLDDAELEEVRRHRLYTEQHPDAQLSRSRTRGDGARHHERLDGRGYHRGLRATAAARAPASSRSPTSTRRSWRTAPAAARAERRR